MAFFFLRKNMSNFSSKTCQKICQKFPAHFFSSFFISLIACLVKNRLLRHHLRDGWTRHCLQVRRVSDTKFDCKWAASHAHRFDQAVGACHYRPQIQGITCSQEQRLYWSLKYRSFSSSSSAVFFLWIIFGSLDWSLFVLLDFLPGQIEIREWNSLASQSNFLTLSQAAIYAKWQWRWVYCGSVHNLVPHPLPVPDIVVWGRGGRLFSTLPIHWPFRLHLFFPNLFLLFETKIHLNWFSEDRIMIRTWALISKPFIIPIFFLRWALHFSIYSFLIIYV